MFGLETVIFRINTLSVTVGIVYLIPVGNILKKKLILCVLLCDTKQHRVKEVPVMVMKCMEGTRTQGGGGQEYTQTLDRLLNYFILLFPYIFYKPHVFEAIQDKGMGKCKRKTVRKLVCTVEKTEETKRRLASVQN